MKIRLSRLNAWLKRLQWPLAWKGFLRPAPVVVPTPPSPAFGVMESWQMEGQSQRGEAVRIVLPALPDGGRHVLTGAHALCSGEAQGEFRVHADGGAHCRAVKGERTMTWAAKPIRGGPGQEVEILLHPSQGERAALSISGYTEWEMSDAQD